MIFRLTTAPFLTLVFLCMAVVMPFSAEAASKACSTDAVVTITEKTLTSSSVKPTLSGTATDAQTIQVVLRSEDSGKIVYKSKIIKVKNEKWKVNVSKKQAKGEYEVEVFCPRASTGTSMINETLVVGSKTSSSAQTTFVVSSIPLLSGGTVHAGTAVPVAYLQVTNIGKGSGTLKGFWVKQNGSASTNVITALSTADDTGSLRSEAVDKKGEPLFAKGLAFAPASAVFEAGQMRLFTIKATVTGNVSTNIGKELKLDVVSVEGTSLTKSMFPIRGTTWTVTQ